MKPPTVSEIHSTLEKALAKSIGKDYRPEIGIEVSGVIYQSLVNHINGLTEEEIFPRARLKEDIGAGSEGFAISKEIQNALSINLKGYGDLLYHKVCKNGKIQQKVLGLMKIVYEQRVK